MNSAEQLKKVVVIDDEPQSRQTLKFFLKEYCPDVEFVGEADSVSKGVHLIRQVNPDAVFLGVQLKEGTGFDLLDMFRYPSFQVIFTTAYDEFALKAFKYNAIDYLLKPLDVDELVQAVGRIELGKNPQTYAAQIAALEETNRAGRLEKIAVADNDGLHFLKLQDIVRLESDVNYTTFHLVSGERITVSKTLKNFAQLLPETEFFRPHQSHIININYMEKILREDGGFVLMKDQTRIPIARSKKEELLKMVQDRFLT
ncbi:MAG: LytTR family DNA-binding domain-containing protein [Saprospiraceae bacterium]